MEYFFLLVRLFLISLVLANSELQSIDCGGTKHVLFINTPFSPIRCKADAFVSHYIITPETTFGLEFNQVTGEFSGIYTGSAQTITYEIQAINAVNSITTSITFDFQGRFLFSFLFS